MRLEIDTRQVLTRFFLFIVGLFIACDRSPAQKIDNYFKEISLPIKGSKSLFGMRDLHFFSDPVVLSDEIIWAVDPNGEYQYIDSLSNMETREFISVDSVKYKYHGFFRGQLSSNGCYFLIYSKDVRGDEYSYHIVLNIYDKTNALKNSLRIYSASEAVPFRNFFLSADSLITVDYLSDDTIVTAGEKKMKIIKTNFDVTSYKFDVNGCNYVKVSTSRSSSKNSPALYINSDSFIIDDPIGLIH